MPVQPGTVAQRGWKKGTGTIYRNGLEGAAHKWCLSHFSDELGAGPKRNFQVIEPLEFLAEFTQHIPPKGAHLIRYYGWYSNKTRGIRRKAVEQAASASTSPLPPREGGVRAGRCSQTWAMLIKRIYEVDPLACPKCGSRMKVIAFIEPPQGVVVEKILRHCGLWNPVAPRAPPTFDACIHEGDGFADDSSHEPQGLTYVDIDMFEATF